MNKPVWNRWLAVGCVCVLCGILVATLWPFNPRPRNQVTWVENGNGVHLGGQGTILSSALFQTADSSAGASCSLELWAESDLVWNTGTLLGYYSPENLVSFSLSQFNGGLDLRRGFRDGEGRVRQSALYLKDAVARGGKSFIAITASGRETAIYLDGTL